MVDFRVLTGCDGDTC